MKKLLCLFLELAVSLFLFACNYENPLVKESLVPVDKSLCGTIYCQANTKGNITILRIFKFSDTEYLLAYGDENRDKQSIVFYFRAYPVKIADLNLVQLQLIGSSQVPGAATNQKYDIISYSIAENGDLTVKTINKKLIPKTIADPEILKSEIIKNKADKELFTDEIKFKLIEKISSDNKK